MKVKLKINPKYPETEIHVCGNEDNEDIRKVCRVVKEAVDTSLTAYAEDEVVFLPSAEIIRIFSQSKKVYAAAGRNQYRLHERLYELEEKLDKTQFIRISNSEIVNLRKILRLDTSVTGTIKMYLQEEQETYVSRRYVPKIKKALGVGKEVTL